MTWLLVIFIVLSVLLFATLCVAGFYLYRFAKIIMVLEDDFSDAIESLNDVEATLEKILGMRLFFDSKEVQLVVQEALAEVKTSRMSVNRLIQRFLERSKQKYTVLIEEESVEDLKDRLLREKMLKGENGLLNDFEKEINPVRR